MKISGEDFLSAVIPILKLLSLIIIGLILAHPRTQIIPKATFKLLSKLVFALFLPCLIFVHLGESVTLQNALLWWFIPVNVIISTAIGCLLGYIVVIVCHPPPQLTRFTIIMTAFGNTGNIPLSIVGSVCHTTANPFGLHCHRRGVAYVSFAQWVSVIIVYTLVYHMMEAPLEYYDVVNEALENPEGGCDTLRESPPCDDASRPLLVEAEWPGIEDKEVEHSKIPLIARVFNSIYNLSQSTFPEVDHQSGERSGSGPGSIRCMTETRVVQKIRVVVEQTPIKHVLQPPTISSLLAIIIGIVPQLKAVVFGEDAPLSFISDSLEILAGAMVPFVMLILGGMLAEGPDESTLGLRTTVGISVARLLVLPLVGIVIVTLADKCSFLIHGDEMYRFVLLLQYTMPSAILLGAIASLRGYAVKEASALLFWQHVFALFSLSLNNVFCLHLYVFIMV